MNKAKKSKAGKETDGREERQCLIFQFCNVVGSEQERSRHMSAGEERSTRCDRVERALRECHRRVPEGVVRQSACMHLNRALAQCILSEVCPEESEAVRSLCSSDGTVLKRSQCQQAKLYLSQCISSHRQAS